MVEQSTGQKVDTHSDSMDNEATVMNPVKGLSKRKIEKGKRTKRSVPVDNVELRCIDRRDQPPPTGRIPFIHQSLELETD